LYHQCNLLHSLIVSYRVEWCQRKAWESSVRPRWAP
jgi:hypothetical protein